MKTISVLIFALFICSCNTIKHIDKTKTDTKTETVVNTVTTKTITETAVEDVKIKSDSLIADIPINFDSDSIVEENENLKLVITKNKKTGKIRAKAIQKEKVVPVNIKRVTIENSVKNEKTKTHTVAKIKQKDVERTGGLNLNYLWWLLILLLIPIYKYRRQLLGLKR